MELIDLLGIQNQRDHHIGAHDLRALAPARRKVGRDDRVDAAITASSQLRCLYLIACEAITVVATENSKSAESLEF